MIRQRTILAGGAGVGVACAIIGGFIGRGSMLHVALAIPALCLVLLLLGFCALLSLTLLARRSLGKSRDRVHRSIIWLLSVVAACVGMISSAFVGSAIVSLDVLRTKIRAEGFIPLLESYRDKHDAYPFSLAEIGKPFDAPSGVRDGELRYEGDLDSYQFGITVTSGFGVEGWIWKSSDPRWTYWRD